MRVTTIRTQTERKRQDRSARCAEKHRRRARTRQLRGLIPTVPAARPAAEAAQGENMLVQRSDSGDLHVKRHSTWGISVTGNTQLRNAISKLRGHRVVFTITPGRSGSKLLAALSQCISGVQAVHEAPPRMNYVFRGLCSHPPAAGWWLESEMFPAIAQSLRGKVFFETSHLFCKGFIEPTLELGLRPGFVILSRPATQVASSLYAIQCIPERTGTGRLVLLGPTDPGVEAPQHWQDWSDYQLCYWYAKEIERRQADYERWLPTKGCDVFRVQLAELLDLSTLPRLARFLTRQNAPAIDQKRAASVLSRNQNPKGGLTSQFVRPPPVEERARQEAEVDQSMPGKSALAS